MLCSVAMSAFYEFVIGGGLLFLEKFVLGSVFLAQFVADLFGGEDNVVMVDFVEFGRSDADDAGVGTTAQSIHTTAEQNTRNQHNQERQHKAHTVGCKTGLTLLFAHFIQKCLEFFAQFGLKFVRPCSRGALPIFFARLEEVLVQRRFLSQTPITDCVRLGLTRLLFVEFGPTHRALATTIVGPEEILRAILLILDTAAQRGFVGFRKSVCTNEL